MFHNGNPAVIETDDIATVEATGPVQTMADGRQAIPVLLVIDPASGKHYDAGEGPAAIHLTNGVGHRLIGLVESVLHIHPADPAAEEAPAASEARVEPPAAEEAPAASEARVEPPAAEEAPAAESGTGASAPNESESAAADETAEEAPAE